MKIAALQLSAFKKEREIESYIKAAYDSKAKIVLVGEYLLNPFFKTLENDNKSKILKLIEDENEKIIKISTKYSITIVAPVIEVHGNKLYKSIAIINKGKVIYYKAQKLMPYDHWNEVKFFSNTSPKAIKDPYIFNMGGIKFATLFGYELHFDEFWIKLKKENVDCVLLPTASTFDSSLRWRSIIKMRAFLNNCYILRANRIGQYEDDFTNTLWNFYGDSLFVDPSGEVIDCLGDREELLIVDVNKKHINEIKECWKFR